MEDKRGEKFRKELEDLLTLVKDNGIAAIAFASAEQERIRLLSVMQQITRKEITLKKSLLDYEAAMHLEVIADAPELDLDTIAESGEVLQMVKVNQKND